MVDVWTPLANLLGYLILKYADQVLDRIDNDVLQEVTECHAKV